MNQQVPALNAGTCTQSTLSTLSTGTPIRWNPRPRIFRARRPQLETLAEYAGKLLRYCIVAGPYILDTEQLALADMAAQRAASQVTGQDGCASKLSPAQLAVLATLSSIRHQIARLDRAARDAARMTQAPAPPPAPATNGGRLAPLEPPPPTMPPAPAYAEPRPYLHRPRPQADGIGF